MAKVKLALVGAGAIGKRHLEAIHRNQQADLIAIVDPSAEIATIAHSFAVPHFTDLDSLTAALPFDGVVIATPTEHHLSPILQCLDTGAHVLVEKPVVATLQEAAQVVAKSTQTNRQVLVGHHRRYYGLVNRAREIVRDGEIGQLVTITGQWTVRKPPEYYAQAWRRKWQAGPILTNLIHEMDLLRYIAGDLISLMAETTNFVQGFEKEDAAAVVMRFKSGALGSFVLSDQCHSPWSWEQATGETPLYPFSGQNPIRFMGTEGALEFPALKIWRTPHGPPEWRNPIEMEEIPQALENAFDQQIDHFADVIRGKQEPRITAADAAETLKATLAIYESARIGQRVTL